MKNLCSMAWLFALAGGMFAQTDDLPTFTLPQLGAGPSLLIFVSEYGDDSVFPNLPGVLQDKTIMVEAVQKLGFARPTVLVNPTNDEMKAAMSNFGKAAASSPRASFFYFSGHGVLHNHLNYLIPAHAAIETQGHLQHYATPAEHVFGFVAGKKTAGPCLFFIDACRNNSLPASDKASGGDGIALNRQAGMFIGYATAEGSKASLTAQGSLFTVSLARRLLTPGRSVDDVFSGVVADVEARSSTAGGQNLQPPQKESSLRYVLHLVPASGAPVPPLQPVAGTPPAAPVKPAAVVDARMKRLVGFWTRLDSGAMVISIRSVGADGALSAGYANPGRSPSDVHVSKASARVNASGKIAVTVQMDDVGYRGSIYRLVYDAASDRLEGKYKPEGSDEFDVSFSRTK